MKMADAGAGVCAVPRGHLLAMFGVQRAVLLHGGGSCVLKAMGLLAGRQWYLVCNIFYVGKSTCMFL